jgi:hypothetical protein
MAYSWWENTFLVLAGVVVFLIWVRLTAIGWGDKKR